MSQQIPEKTMSKIFDDLMEALMEVKDHMEGRIKLPSTRVAVKTTPENQPVKTPLPDRVLR